MYLLYQHWGYGMAVNGIVESIADARIITDSIIDRFYADPDQYEFKEILFDEQPGYCAILRYGMAIHNFNKYADFYLYPIELNAEITSIEAEG